MTRLYLIGGVLAVFLGLAGALWLSWQVNDRLRSDNAALRASVAALKLEGELSRDARAVANARATWFEGKAKEYDQLREGILRDGKDADLPDWLAAVLGGLRGNPNSQAD